MACLALVDPASGERWLIDATPDFRAQLARLDGIAPPPLPPGLAGILLTHGHMGHYTGLVHLGSEAMSARDVPVYAMPRMRAFLEANGPWNQLVDGGHITLREMRADEPVRLNDRLTAVPLPVPHRDEVTETVGFRFEGGGGSVLYVPDIDGWHLWTHCLEAEIATVDAAYVDATFFDADELPGRDLSRIQHPFVVDTLARLRCLSPPERAKVRLIHFNHTNPLLSPNSAARQRLEAAGLHVAEEGERLVL